MWDALSHSPSEDAFKNKHLPGRRGKAQGNTHGKATICLHHVFLQQSFEDKQSPGRLLSCPLELGKLWTCLYFSSRRRPHFWLSPACKLQPKLELRNSLHCGELMWFSEGHVDFGEVMFIYSFKSKTNKKNSNNKPRLVFGLEFLLCPCTYGGGGATEAIPWLPKTKVTEALHRCRTGKMGWDGKQRKKVKKQQCYSKLHWLPWGTKSKSSSGP